MTAPGSFQPTDWLGFGILLSSQQACADRRLPGAIWPVSTVLVSVNALLIVTVFGKRMSSGWPRGVASRATDTIRSSHAAELQYPSHQGD